MTDKERENKTMTDITLEDIKRVYDKTEAADAKLDDKIEKTREEFNRHTQVICDNLAQMSTSTAVMSERLAQMSEKISGLSEKIAVMPTTEDIPEVPERPCIHFERHVTEHKEAVDSWKKPLIVGFIAVILTFIQEPIRELFRRIFSSGG